MDEEIKLYQSEDALVKLEVRIEKDTIWLTQKQIGILFDVQKAAISKHLKNIFESGELNLRQLFPFWKQLPQMGKHTKSVITI